MRGKGVALSSRLEHLALLSAIAMEWARIARRRAVLEPLGFKIDRTFKPTKGIKKNANHTTSDVPMAVVLGHFCSR